MIERSDLRDARLRRMLDYIRYVRDELRDEAIRIDVVQTVDDLPPSAPANRWFRVRSPSVERANVYVGNGPNQPLSVFATTPVEGGT